MRHALLAFAFLSILSVAAVGASAHDRAHHDVAHHAQTRTNVVSEQDIPHVAIDLADHEGRRVSFADLLGRGPFILSFSYLNCPSQCPTSDLVMGQASQAAAARRPELRFVTLTLDPERDDVAALGKQHEALGSPANWLWATGDPGPMRRLLRTLGVEPGPLEAHGVQFLVGSGASGKMTRTTGLPDDAVDLLALAERYDAPLPR
ncbi:SCO family protein [Methylopila sp. M107]|uniref:SCO family protein n=1 Tax=Methylopila sp. M107 TaxID=1101190 RepID=UPI0018CA1353|nr:SCO family protein [Methylopila sp. M107]